MQPRATLLLALCMGLAAALPYPQYEGETWGESQQYADTTDDRQERGVDVQPVQAYQQSDDLTQDTQSFDLPQQSQQYQQSDDLTQETQQSDDLTQDSQQSDILPQQTQRYQKAEDLAQESQRYQRSDDLTQESQQSDDLTQETQQYQQSDDLTQETQQSDDLTQDTQQSDDLTQETRESSDVFQQYQDDQQSEDISQQSQRRIPSGGSRRPPQRVNEGFEQESSRLTDARPQDENRGGRQFNNGGNTGDNSWSNGGSTNTNGNTGDNGWNNGGSTNTNGNTGDNGWNNGAGTNTGNVDTPASVDRPGRPLTPPSDYKRLPAFGTAFGHYKVYTNAKLWVEALVICAADGAELAIARSEGEATEMGRLYKTVKKDVKGSADKELFFVGASDLAKENDFVTLSGERFSGGFYVNWQKGEPNNHKKNEHCVLSNDLGFYWDGNCNAKFAFMCRFKTDPCAQPPF